MDFLKYVLLLIIFPIMGYSQVNTDWGIPYNSEKEAFIYEDVIMVEGASKEELYSRSLNWIKSYFTAGANKITNKNKEKGIIELKDRLIFYRMEKKSKVKDAIIDYNMTIFIKEGKIKYQITNFRAFMESRSPHIERWMEARYSDPEDAKVRFEKLDKEIQKLIDNLNSSIVKGESQKEDDW